MQSQSDQETYIIDMTLEIQKYCLNKLEAVNSVDVSKMLVGERCDEDVESHPNVLGILDEGLFSEHQEIAKRRKHLCKERVTQFLYVSEEPRFRSENRTIQVVESGTFEQVVSDLVYWPHVRDDPSAAEGQVIDEFPGLIIQLCQEMHG